MASPILQFKRGAFINLPGLRAGEPALTNDTFDLYVGIDSTTNNNKFLGLTVIGLKKLQPQEVVFVL